MTLHYLPFAQTLNRNVKNLMSHVKFTNLQQRKRLLVTLAPNCDGYFLIEQNNQKHHDYFIDKEPLPCKHHFVRHALTQMKMKF
jgi:hypothetical protein